MRACIGNRTIPMILGALLLAPPAAAQWDPGGVPVCTQPFNQQDPFTISDGAGGVYVAWSDARLAGPTNPTPADIYLSHFLSDGTLAPGWPAEGLPVCSDPADQIDPLMTTDDAGGAIVVWMDYRAGNFDLYAQHVLPSGIVDPAWPVNGVALTSAPADQTPNRSGGITPDGAGGAYVVWQDDRDFMNPDNLGSDVYAQHVTATGTIAPGWAADGTPVAATRYVQDEPVIIGDGAGGIYIAWRDTRDNWKLQLYTMRMDATGAIAPGWVPNGIPVISPPALPNVPQLVPDDADGAFLFWFDGFQPSIHPYALRLTPEGGIAPGWPAAGVLLSTTICDGSIPSVARDGHGGAYFAWTSFATPTDTADVILTRVTADGVIPPPWTAAGLRVTGVGRNVAGQLVEDGLGGVVVVWVETQDLDIWATRITESGTRAPNWPDRAPVGVASGYQSNQWATTDGAGGAYAAWLDARNDIFGDIYLGRTNYTPPVVAIEFDLDPKKIKLGGHRMDKIEYGHFEPPAPYTPSDFDVASIRLEGVIAPLPDEPVEEDDYDRDGIPDLRVAFSRNELGLLLPPGLEVPVTATGHLGSNDFTGTDTVRVKHGRIIAPTAGEVLSPGTSYTIRYEISSTLPAATATLLHTFDDGATWVSDATGPNTGAIEWTVPDVVASGARVAVVEVEDEDGGWVTGVLGVSDPFDIEGALGAGFPAPVLELSPVQPTPSEARFRAQFTLPRAGYASLALYDLSGRKVCTLMEGSMQAGRHDLEWRGHTDRGTPVGAGLYFLRLDFGGAVKQQRVVWLR